MTGAKSEKTRLIEKRDELRSRLEAIAKATSEELQRTEEEITKLV